MDGWGQDEPAGTRRRRKTGSQETVIGDSLYFVDEKLRTMMATANGLDPLRSSDLTVPLLTFRSLVGEVYAPPMPINSLVIRLEPHSQMLTPARRERSFGDSGVRNEHAARRRRKDLFRDRI
jgi:hypothetical protein